MTARGGTTTTHLAVSLVAFFFVVLGLLGLWWDSRVIFALVARGEVLFLTFVVLSKALWFGLAYGLWTAKRWARWLTIGLSALMLLGAPMDFDASPTQKMTRALVAAVVLAICAWWPIRRGVPKTGH